MQRFYQYFTNRICVASHDFNPVHMTICFLGEADEATLGKAKAALKVLHKVSKQKAFKFELGQKDLFGANNDVRVMRLKIQDRGVEQLMLEVARSIRRQGSMAWHVSVKDDALFKEFSSLDRRPRIVHQASRAV